MNNYQDFGFSGEEFQGEMTTVPYCQFLNASSQKFGIAITGANAELASFKADDNWQAIPHEFSDGTNETLLVSQQPRLLIMNRSQALMSDGATTLPYSKLKYAEGEYKAFSYVVVWFLDSNNQPLSELPFRLKCSGYAGLTFLKNYSYYNNPHSFCRQFLNIYKSLTGDRAISKNDVFYGHGVYQPNLVRQKATSSQNGQSSFAVMTDSFIEPSTDNFASLIIKNGSPVSDKIKQFQETTKSWLKTVTVEFEVESQHEEEIQHQALSVAEKTDSHLTNGVTAGLTPEPIRF
ncbi:MAG: DUF5895 domain-containing protein [Cyanobacteria bacterium P01_G01_bin.39]